MKLKIIVTSFLSILLIIVLVCVEIFIPRHPVQQCLFVNTINITGGIYLQNGRYKFENVVYEKRMFQSYNKLEKEEVDTHLRGCVCVVKPCIRLCKHYDDLMNITVVNEENVVENIDVYDNKNFHMMIHSPCDDMYALNSDEDHFVFFKVSKMKSNVCRFNEMIYK